jgi:hypothetical protein
VDCQVNLQISPPNPASEKRQRTSSCQCPRNDCLTVALVGEGRCYGVRRASRSSPGAVAAELVFWSSIYCFA